MTGYGHLAIGTSLSLAASSFFPQAQPYQIFIFVSVGAVASLLPDMDAQESVLKVIVRSNYNPTFANSLFPFHTRKGIFTPLVHSILSAIEIAIRSISVLFMDLVHLIFGHRGITHYLITSISFTLVVFILLAILKLPLEYSFAFFIGYTSHILGDMCTTSGIKFFSPYASKKCYVLPKSKRIRMQKTMTLREGQIVAFVAIVSLLVIFVNSF